MILASALLALQGAAQYPTAHADSLALRQADGRQPPAIVAFRAPRPPAIDGRLDDPTWRDAQPASGFRQVSPQDGADPSQRTEVWVAYDAGALYIAARLFETDPSNIVGRLGRRDGETSSDLFTVVIDSYHDHQTAFRFRVNPAGVREDAVLANDRDDADATWDPVWDVATHTDSVGWTVEMRIPLSQLRFANRATPVWGINFTRYRFRQGELDRWSWTPNTEQGFASNFGHLLGLENLAAPRRTDLLPYVVTRSEHVEGVDPANPFTDGSTQGVSGGLDLKYGLTSNVTIDATMNPDFGQVEADPAVVNLTAFETFFEERRPFFIEGANIFRFGQGGGGFIFGAPQLFYSRRVGRSPSRQIDEPGGYVHAPEATTILGAAKVTGQSGGWQLGLLDAVTAREHARVQDAAGEQRAETVEPFSNYTVGSLRRNLRGGASGIGFVGTSVVRQIDEPALDFLRSSAFTGGVDFFHRFGRNQFLINGTLSGTAAFGDPVSMTLTQRSPTRYYQRPDQRYMNVDTTATSLTGYAASLSAGRVAGHWTYATDLYAYSPGFEVNDLGFETTTDRIFTGVRVSRRWLEPGKVFRSFEIDATYAETHNFGWTRLGRAVYLGGGGTFTNLWYAGVSGQNSFRSLSDKLTRGGPLMVQPESWNAGGYFGSDNRKRVTLNGSATYARNEFGGWGWFTSAAVSLRPSGAVTASVAPGYERVHALAGYVTQRADDAAVTYGRRYVFADLDQETVDITLRLDVALTPSLSIQLYAQPFIASGDYTNFKELAAASTFDFVR
jgi:hypothetical protein